MSLSESQLKRAEAENGGGWYPKAACHALISIGYSLLSIAKSLKTLVDKADPVLLSGKTEIVENMPIRRGGATEKKDN